MLYPPPYLSYIVYCHFLSNLRFQFKIKSQSIEIDHILYTIFKVSFSAFNQRFVLSLFPSHHIFAPNFKAYNISSSGEKTEIDIDQGRVMQVSVLVQNSAVFFLLLNHIRIILY